MTFKELAELWLHEKRNFVKESTFCLYQFEVRKYLVPTFGRFALERLSEDVVQESFFALQRHGCADGRLKKTTLTNVVMLFKQILKFGVAKKYMQEYRMRIRLACETAWQDRTPVLDSENQRKIVDAVKKDPSMLNFGILLCLFTGIRIGELCALRWENFDFATRTLRVEHTLQRIYKAKDTPNATEIIITSPKTKHSFRRIPLCDFLYDMILQESMPKPSTCYLLTGTERFIEPRSMRKHYKKFCQTHGIDGKHFHCLRHSFATRCIAYGADCKAVSEILGHASVNVTLNRYVHPAMEEKKRCMEMMARDW